MKLIKSFSKCAVFGAGGIGCHFVPMIARMMETVIVDGDKYEPKNVERQFPALKSEGNKAEILSGFVAPTTIHHVHHVPSYLKGLDFLRLAKHEDVDILFGCVDNDTARNMIMDLADEYQIPAILGGNEQFFGDAHAFIPEVYDPRNAFSFDVAERQQFACNSDKVLEEAPQTAYANILATGAMMQLFLSLRVTSKPHNTAVYSRLEPNSSTLRRIRDFGEDDWIRKAATKEPETIKA